MRKLISIGLLLLSVQFGLAQSRVQLELSSDTLLIGQVLEVSLELERNMPEKWQAASVDDTSWVILSQSIDTIAWKENRTYIQKLELTRFDSGQHLLSFHPLVLAEESVRVSASYVFVNLPQKTDQELTDIHDPFDAPFNWPFYIALPLGIIALLVLIYFLVKRLQQRPSQEPQEEPILKDPRGDALRMLDEYAAQKLWEQDLKHYYTAISHVLRLYLESSFRIRALEMTGNELAGQLHLLQLSPDDAKELKSFLQLADFAKYAEKGETGRDLAAEISLLQHIIRSYPKAQEEDENSKEEQS